MISRFWDELFKLRDQYKENHQFTAWNAVGKVEEILQNAYDDGLQFKSHIRDKRPESKLEELVLSIPDINVYYDNLDKTYWYELDNRHFDYPEEVIEWLITCRTNLESDVMVQCKSDVLAYMSKLIKETAPLKVIEKRQTRKVIGDRDEQD